MNSESRCPPGNDLIAAYLATTYRVVLDNRTEDVRIGQVHPHLDRLSGGSCWVIITAFNPGSNRLSDSENRHRHRQLIECVETVGLISRPTRHIAEDGSWPVEQGLFIVDADDEWAHQQAREFGQLGIVHARVRAVAELWLYDGFSSWHDPAHVRRF